MNKTELLKVIEAEPANPVPRYRIKFLPLNRYDSLGFRLARVLSK